MAPAGRRRVRGVAAGLGEADDRVVAGDEIAPDLLERVDEIGRRGRGVDGEVGGQVGAVVRWRDGVLVFPALLAGAGEGFCEPVAGTGVGGLAVEVVCALLLTGGEFGLVQGRWAAVAKGIE